MSFEHNLRAIAGAWSRWKALFIRVPEPEPSTHLESASISHHEKHAHTRARSVGEFKLQRLAQGSRACPLQTAIFMLLALASCHRWTHGHIGGIIAEYV